MIPIRVCVEGFMSYHDKAELCFDGAPVWMLSGLNGAGKSTIFDAITFALYGIHRGGKQNVDQLINHQTDRMAVEFDFRLGEDCYRVKRTASRRGRASYQALHLSGPNAPSARRSGPQEVPETDSKEGLKSWVERQLGMNDEAFIMSVLLRQGKSDVLLEADPRERHRLLCQLVDLSAYERLYKRADDQMKQAQERADDRKRQLNDMSDIDEAQFAALAEEISRADELIHMMQAQLEHIAGLKVYAQRWNELTNEHTNLRSSLAKAQTLFAQGEDITDRANRYKELSGVLEPLNAISRHLQNRDTNRGCAEKVEHEIHRWATKLAETRALHVTRQVKLEQLEVQQGEAQEHFFGAQETLLVLAPHIAKLNDLDLVRQEIEPSEQKLASFPADLDVQINQLRLELAELAELREVLPHLQQFARAGDSWREAAKSRQAAEASRASLAAQLSDKDHAKEIAETELEQAKNRVEELFTMKTTAQTLHDEARKQLKRFETVAEQQTCSYCGQLLTPEHRNAERQRLRQDIEVKTAAVRDAGHAHASAERDQAERAQALQKLVKECQDLERKMRDLDHTMQTADRDKQRAEADGQAALAAISESYRARIRPSLDVDIVTCFALRYPSSDDLAALQKRANQHKATQSRLEKLNDEATKRNHAQAQREQIVNRMEILVREYPAERESAIRHDQIEAQRQQELARQQLNDLKPSLANARQHCDDLKHQIEQAEAQQRDLLSQKQKAMIHMEDAQRAIDEYTGMLPPAWQSVVPSLTTTQLEEWQTEQDALQGSDEQYDALVQARQERAVQEQRSKQIEQDMEAVPAEARQLLTTLEANEAKTRQQHRAAVETHRRADQQRLVLEAKRAQRQQLEEEYQDAERQARLYGQLARLLGRDYLQRYLLQQAEECIIVYANDVLDRCSGGTLHLELRQNTEGISESAAQKAFDLIAQHTETSSESLPAWLLSGSQRFRVAVSLALGIGQYASQNARRIESVIIDEGFGSLDKQGRRDMIDALRDLRGTVSRIILVSHQEEFADAFSNRYSIELVNGTSRVSLIEQT